MKPYLLFYVWFLHRYVLFLSIADYSGYKRITRSAVEWFVTEHKLGRYKFDIDIVVRGLLREGLHGACSVTDSTYRPREFLIELHSVSKEKTTSAH